MRIVMVLEEMEHESLEWIQVAQDMDQWQLL
jgi:hypothetical protein